MKLSYTRIISKLTAGWKKISSQIILKKGYSMFLTPSCVALNKVTVNKITLQPKEPL